MDDLDEKIRNFKKEGKKIRKQITLIYILQVILIWIAMYWMVSSLGETQHEIRESVNPVIQSIEEG